MAGTETVMEDGGDAESGGNDMLVAVTERYSNGADGDGDDIEGGCSGFSVANSALPPPPPMVSSAY